MTVWSKSIEQQLGTLAENWLPSLLTLQLKLTIPMAFDFEKLEVYSKAKIFNKDVSLFLDAVKLSRNKKDQLERAAFSIMLNIAEGSGRFTKPDNFKDISL